MLFPHHHAKSLVIVIFDSDVSLINGFKVFREAYLIAGDYPEQHIYLLQHLFNNWFRDLSVNKLAAGAVLMGLVLFVLIMVFQKLFDRETS